MYISAHFKRAALAIVDFSLLTFVYGVLIFFILLFLVVFGVKVGVCFGSSKFLGQMEKKKLEADGVRL